MVTKTVVRSTAGFQPLQTPRLLRGSFIALAYQETRIVLISKKFHSNLAN